MNIEKYRVVVCRFGFDTYYALMPSDFSEVKTKLIVARDNTIICCSGSIKFLFIMCKICPELRKLTFNLIGEE
jgi:hypothetical protein